VLRETLPVDRIILFGSLAHQGWFGPHSDVDLAVEGLPGSAYWKAWRLLEEALPERRIDLIDLDTAGPSLRQAITRTGIPL
jgi:predicted nucleotidyltransferase